MLQNIPTCANDITTLLSLPPSTMCKKHVHWRGIFNTRSEWIIVADNLPGVINHSDLPLSSLVGQAHSRLLFLIFWRRCHSNHNTRHYHKKHCQTEAAGYMNLHLSPEWSFIHFFLKF
jgi:hypothetical protein